MALKFKSVVVTAVLICDPSLVSGLHDSCVRVLAFLEFCSHEYIFKGTPSFVRYMGASLKILLSNGCCVMKCQLFMSIGFKLGTAG